MNRLTINVVKAFGKKIILDNLQLALNQNEIIGIFGRNGTGKSTLFKTIFGTLNANKIQIRIDGNNIPQKQIIPRKLIAFLPQHNFLPNRIKIRNLIPLFIQDDKSQDRIFYAPKVHSFEKLKPEQLSIGQLKYLQILLISELQHPFLILDEPFAMIEPLYKELIKKLLIRLKPTKGILISDHYYEDVLQITGTNYLLKNGKLHRVNNQIDLNKMGYLTKDQI